MASGQFNVPLSEQYAVALRNLAIRDERSVPELLRPVIERYLDDVLKEDTDLERSVALLLRSKSKAKPGGSVTSLRARRPTKSSGKN